ncbi:MAG: thioredoxin family protein [Candidatus Nitrosocaldus sp.]
MLIPAKEQQHIREIFASKLKHEVNVVVFTQNFECSYCKENRELIDELASLSDGKIKVEVYDFVEDEAKAKEYAIDKIPAIALIGEKDYGIRFFGIPTGYEFGALLDDIIDVSNRKTRLANTTKEALKKIDMDVSIKVFVTPTCPYCPKMVRLAHQFAMESDYITAHMIESIEFPQLANRYNVMAVPKVVINDRIEFEGAVPEPYFVQYVLAALEDHRHT